MLAKACVVARTAGVAYDALAVTSDRPHEAILGAAEAQGCDLIFMASHGHRGVKGLVLANPVKREIGKQHLSWLRDGSRLLASEIRIEADKLTITPPLSGKPVTIALTEVDRIEAEIDRTLAQFQHRTVRFDHLSTRRAGKRRFVDLHMHLPANWTLGRAAALRGSVEQALMSAVPGLRASIQLLPSDVEAHFDDEEDLI